ncbi:MAG: TOBE domain-containing protein, partial [Bauldia sp.]|nr:TOBE domain-containing protein [Bauldia sp.]
LSLRPAGESGVGGRVVSRSFLGDAQLLHVFVPGLAHPLLVQVPVQVLIGIGDDVTVRLSTESAFVFPAG